MRSFAVYLFDVDGTLLDSADDICGAVSDVLAGTPCGRIRVEDLKRYVGVDLLGMYRDLLPGASEERYEAMVQEYRRLYPARGHRATRVYPGVPEMLAALAGRKSTATTKGSASTRAILEQFGLLPHFDHVQGTDGFAYKPAPDVILAALNALGAEPRDCLFVGDAPSDMEAGRRAGVTTCAVRWGYGDPEGMARWTPDYWISKPEELAPAAAAHPLPAGSTVADAIS
jgi:HAD superfamily hydrolase (TIGR01509 family)